MDYFEELINDVVTKYSTLSVTKTESGATLSGQLILNAEYEDIPLYDEYEVEITVPKDYPCHLPTVREISNLVPTELQHFLSDGSFCLAAQCELIDFARNDGTIKVYIDKYVMNYLYTASYFSRYGEVPFGERAHGVDGIKEAYMDRYKCENEAVLFSLLCFLTGIEKYRGHSLCPCGSGKKLRDCHGKLVISDIKSDFFDYYRNDAYRILYNYLEKRKEVIDYGK